MSNDRLPPGKANFETLHPLHFEAPNASMMSYGQANMVLLLTPMSQHLLAQARDLSARGEHQFAVVLAHAACELATEESLNNLIRRRNDPELIDLIMAFVPNGCSLADTRIRRVFAVLTGEYPAGNSELKIDPAPWWKAWDTSRNLRNQVAHAGVRVIDEQAVACLNAVDAYLAHIAAIVAKITK